ncbi:MAG: DUF4358 domain-containing protein [Lachnospiraceae bacterium]|nr:DUF4358 domain-containing protein [Lachnospiraceae bacterium]
MKKLTILFLTAVLSLNMIGCGRSNADNGGASSESSQETSAVESQPESEVQNGQTEPEQSEAAETGEDGISAEMSAIRQAVVDVMGDNYWPNTQFPPEYLESYGLTSEMYTDFFGEMPMISTNVDTLIVIKASDGQTDAVEEVLNSYRDTLVSDTMQYPMNVGKIQASRIEVIGDYVCFVQLGADVTELMEVSDEEVIRYCQEQNELALEAIGKAALQ